MYGSILNQVEPSVNLYSQTTQPSSYYGIWTTTLGVNQVTFVKDLESSTISGYNSNVMIIKQLDNKNKYKTKLIRTMQIDENSNIYFSGCTINNGQANQIYYGTGYSWVLVNNEYTPPSGGGGEMSYNLFAQATEPDTYDGIWTTKLDVDTVKFTDLEVIEVGEMRENDVNISTTTYMSEQQFVIDGDLLYIISGAYTTSSSLTPSGLGTNFITVYNMSTKKFVKKITIPYNNGMYGHTCVLYNNIIYIVGGVVGTITQDMISDRIVMYDITNDEFSQSSVLPKLCYNKTFIYDNIIYIVGGYVGNQSTASTLVYKYNILNDTYTSVPSPYTILDSGGVQVGSTAYIICGSQNGVRSNAVLRYELLTDTWSVQKYVDFKSTIRYGYYYKDGYLYATAADPDYYSYSAPASVLKTDFVDYNYETVYSNTIIERSSLAAVVNLNNKIYIIGGRTSSTSYYNSVVIYDIDTKTHTTGAVCPYSGYLSACCLYDNRYIYIFGGRNASGISNTSYRYDTKNNSWSTMSSLPKYLAANSACCVGDYIYIFGGEGGATASSETYQTVTYAYNIVNNTYSTCASLPTVLAHYMVSTGKNDFEILLYGGKTISSAYSRKVYSYNIRENLYSSIFDLPTDEAYSGIVRVGDTVYLLGTHAYCYSVFQTGSGLAGYNLNKTISDPVGVRCIYYNGYIYVVGFRSSVLKNSIRRLRVSKYLNSIPDVTPSASLIGYNDELYMNICRGIDQSPQTTYVSNIYKIETESYLGSYSAYFNIPVGKCYSNAHINDNKLYLYGNSSGGINITDIYIYDLKTESMPMVTSPNLGAPIDACSFLYDSKIYIVGGILYNNTLNSNFVIYDIETMVEDTSLYTEITYADELKRFAHFAFMYNNMIYCCGGYTLADKSSVTPFLVKINMSGDGVITTLTQCPKALIYAQAILIDTKAYVVLGYDPTLVAFNSDILVYDILTDTWSTDLTSTLKLIHHRVLLRGTDIFIFGGEDDLGNLSDKVYKYDTVIKELSEYTKLPFGIAKFGLAYWENEDKAIISGGMVGDPQSESSDIYYCTFKTLDNPSTEIVVRQLDDKHNHSTKLITDNNMKVSFTDVFINSEEPYDVYKGDGTQWIKIT